MLFKDYQSLSRELLKKKQNSVVCLGNFDGIHRGHQMILKECLKRAREGGLASVVFTFSPHPRKFFDPIHGPKLILSESERVELLQQMGFDYLLLQQFDDAFSQIPARVFAEEILSTALRAKSVVMGRDFRFGFRAEGRPDFLRSLGLFEVDECTDLKIGSSAESVTISSSAIRDWIEIGAMDRVQEALGYPYFISGKVVHGIQQAKKWGVPTANIEIQRECLPKTGVYFGIYQDVLTGGFFPSVCNLGYSPTLGLHRFRVEAHLLNFSDELYDRQARLYLLKLHRGEMKFPDAAILKRQIHEDRDSAMKFFYSQNLLHSESQKMVSSLEAPPAACQGWKPMEMIEQVRF